MTTYITNGLDTFTPTVVDGYDVDRASATIVHQVLNRSNPDVTVRPAALRQGTLRMIFADSAASAEALVVDADHYIVETIPEPFALNGEDGSKACVDAVAGGGEWDLVSSERSSILMSWVPSGGIRRSLDDETRDVWIVEIDFHEVE